MRRSLSLLAKSRESRDSWRVARTVLDPIPLLAIPGYSDNDSSDFYDDMQNIRFEPYSRRPRASSDLCAG